MARLRFGRGRVVAVLLAAVLAGGAALVVLAGSLDPRGDPGSVASTVGLDGVLEHLEAFDEIARIHGGTRAAGTAGYDRSAEYVAARLRAAGYEVEVQRFTFTAYVEEGSSLVVDGEEATRDTDFKVMLFSPAGEASGRVVAIEGVDGCALADFDGLPSGGVALVAAGRCRYRDQAANAERAGAGGLLIIARSGTRGVLRGLLAADSDIGIPVVGIEHDFGQSLARTRPFVTLVVDATREERATTNVLGETPTGIDDDAVIVGAHLDSVLDGPGINDNGSGVAAVLEIAEEFAEVDVARKVRFAFWGAEEYGLVGSLHYVDSLSEDERDRIVAYLNFDMIGSPNFVRYVYDGAHEPDGSEAIEELFRSHFAARDIPLEEISIEGRSDHAAFSFAGIPVGGLFTGADMPNNGAIADPCYHLACDDLSNVDHGVLAEMAEAIADVLGSLSGAAGQPPVRVR